MQDTSRFWLFQALVPILGQTIEVALSMTVLLRLLLIFLEPF